MSTANDSEVVGCGHERTLLCLYFHFGRRECPRGRRLLTVPKFLSITGWQLLSFLPLCYLELFSKITVPELFLISL